MSLRRRPRTSWSRIAARGSPTRRCVGCGRSLPKEELLRLVREPGGAVEADPQSRADGRGAYVCRRPECAEGAASGLARSFRTPVRLRPQLIDLIREWQRNASTK
ncbi:MAG: YlxR family protein [Thermoleophilaceae bacterium]